MQELQFIPANFPRNWAHNCEIWRRTRNKIAQVVWPALREFPVKYGPRRPELGNPTRVSKNLDEIDLKILAEIQADGRITNVELAKRVGISPPPCLRRVRTLEEEGYIQGYRGLLDPRRPGNRILVDFDGVMVNATVSVNDHVVATHQGGYLPFSAELTGKVTGAGNLLSVVVDSRCLSVPPVGVGRGPGSVDFFQPGGIYRDVRLRVLPQVFLADLFARPTDVLGSQPRVDIECTLDSAATKHSEGTLLVQLFDGQRQIAAHRQQRVHAGLDRAGALKQPSNWTGHSGADQHRDGRWPALGGRT